MDESIGAKLRQARERRPLNIQQVSELTKVRPHYLQALENDDLSAIPSAAQARGFLRIYADFLGLDLAELVPAVRPEEPAPPVTTSLDSRATEAPKPQRAWHSSLLAWAGERWSQVAGRLTRVGTASKPDSSGQGGASKTDPLERANSPAAPADGISPQREPGSQGVASSARLPIDPKKKAWK